MKEQKKALVRSKKGVEYNVPIDKAKDLIDNYGCVWVSGEPIETKKEEVKEETEQKQPRKRRTKAEIEAQKLRLKHKREQIKLLNNEHN